jgi:two-component system OmpR family response regulator
VRSSLRDDILARVRILLIEDDAETAGWIAEGLGEHGHVVVRCADGNDGLHQALAETLDLLIVDRMLPGLDGLSVVKRLRAAGVQTPVLFLTTLDGIDDRVEGLNAGGDDYVAKPFALAELVARVNALGRRPVTNGEQTRIAVADLEIDFLARSVTRAGKSMDLQPREFRLLEYLARHAGQVVTRTMLLENVWDLHFDPRTNVVDSHVSRLRAKIDKDFDPPLIHTVRGAGSCLRG